MNTSLVYIFANSVHLFWDIGLLGGFVHGVHFQFDETRCRHWFQGLPTFGLNTTPQPQERRLGANREVRMAAGGVDDMFADSDEEAAERPQARQSHHARVPQGLREATTEMRHRVSEREEEPELVRPSKRARLEGDGSLPKVCAAVCHCVLSVLR